MRPTTHRRVDWILIQGSEPTRARRIEPSSQAADGARLAAPLLADPSADTIDHALRTAVEVARDAIGLERVAIFLVAPDRHSMVGTWGTDMRGRTTDEHDLAYAMNDLLRTFFQRSAAGYPWSLYQDCPLVTHEGGLSKTVGRGWNAYTVIQGGGEPLGIMFNDAAISGGRFDETRQARASWLCSLLGRALEPCIARFFDPGVGRQQVRHPLVREAAHRMVSDPSLSFVELAKQLRVSKGHLTRTFRRFSDTSIVDYRNELRLARFLNQINAKPVLTAALDAGFGSYAQFHRVFRARFGKTPRAFLFEQRLARPEAR